MRLQLEMLAALLLVGAGACDSGRGDPPPRPRSRAAHVSAKPTVATAKPTGTPPAASSARKRRKLCAGHAGLPAPKEINLARAAEGAKAPGPLRYGGGRWRWVNVWAAWCKPCIEEMPRLLRWRDQLRKSGVKLQLAFVSIDDDEREMMRFMRKQPATGVRASYWLESEKEREAWFESLGFDEEPTLPVHAFIDPDGKLACLVRGALEPGDYPQLARYLADSNGN